MVAAKLLNRYHKVDFLVWQQIGGSHVSGCET